MARASATNHWPLSSQKRGLPHLPNDFPVLRSTGNHPLRPIGGRLPTESGLRPRTLAYGRNASASGRVCSDSALPEPASDTVRRPLRRGGPLPRRHQKPQRQPPGRISASTASGRPIRYNSHILFGTRGRLENAASSDRQRLWVSPWAANIRGEPSSLATRDTR